MALPPTSPKRKPPGKKFALLAGRSLCGAVVRDCCGAYAVRAPVTMWPTMRAQSRAAFSSKVL